MEPEDGTLHFWRTQRDLYDRSSEDPEGVETAYPYVQDLVAGGKTFLFVGTKKQAQGRSPSMPRRAAPFVNEHWLGGMLTNFATVSGRVKRMQELRAMQAAGDFEGHAQA